jgi:chorismate-pyruvate lyase
MRLSRTMQHPSIATHRRRPLYVGALCSAAKAVSREGPCPFGHCCADRSSCERNDASEIILPAATKLRHAIRRECKLLTRRCELRSSLQSIMGATDIFLLRVNRLHSIHESILGDYSDIPEI